MQDSTQKGPEHPQRLCGNNFHNCNLVWQIQHGSSPRIENNNVETCLIGFIVSRGSAPRIEGNSLHCALVSVGMVMEKSAGNIFNNTFNYVSNGKIATVDYSHAF